MANFYKNVLIDTRTSCSRDEAVAILLGRRSYDPIYHDLNPDCDPEERDAQFLEWLDISIFDELIDERDGILAEYEDAIENKDQSKKDACRAQVIQFDETIRRAKVILCDIDDELAKGDASSLRVVSSHKSTQSGASQITLSSLKKWAEGRNYSNMPLDCVQTQPTPPTPKVDDDEPLLDKKGGMTAKSAKSFLITFAILLEVFVEERGPKYISECGTALNKQSIIDLLLKRSLQGVRNGRYLSDQSKTSIKNRLEEVLKVSNGLLESKRENAESKSTNNPKKS